MNKFEQMRKKIDRVAQKPLRRCYGLHSCFLCKAYIFNGEKYYDGGYGDRMHSDFEKCHQVWLDGNKYKED